MVVFITPRSSSSWRFVLLVSMVVLLLSASLMLKAEAAEESCPTCKNADSILKPCNALLKMDTWPGTLVYQVTEEQAPCGCNQNYYDQMVNCLKCQTSTSAKYSVKDIAGYKLVCLSFGQQWQEILLPPSVTTAVPLTTTTIATTTTALTATTGAGVSGGLSSSGAASPTSSDAARGDQLPTDNTNGDANHLSNGAIAGIVVSVVSLMVALSVAFYVWRRRRRESVQDTGDMDEYKYRDQPDAYMEVALPQYTGMIQSTLPPISKVSNLRVMNPDSDDDEDMTHAAGHRRHASQGSQQHQPSFEVRRNSSPGWRRGSFDDD